MKRIFAALVLALGLFAMPNRAAADNYDNNSLTTCYRERVNWTSNATVTHSHPGDITIYYVDYHCCLDLGGLSHRWNFSTLWWNGETTSHDWSPVYSSWCP